MTVQTFVSDRAGCAVHPHQQSPFVKCSRFRLPQILSDLGKELLRTRVLRHELAPPSPRRAAQFPPARVS